MAEGKVAVTATHPIPPVSRSSTLFWSSLSTVTGAYALFIVAMIAAMAGYATPADLLNALQHPEIRHSIELSLLTCTLTAAISVVVAIPAGYLLSRKEFAGKSLLEAILDIPIVLPPMVMGLALLILFQTQFGHFVEQFTRVTYTVKGVVLAQFVIGCAFAVRTMRATFENLSPRPEDVAMTLGCTRWQAVMKVTLPAARSGIFAAGSVAWARSLGEFGPILVFAGATRGKTEVLPTTVWLELSVGNLEAAVAVSILMVLLAIVVLVIIRRAGERV
jgi:molybdate transport system permease protein